MQCRIRLGREDTQISITCVDFNAAFGANGTAPSKEQAAPAFGA